ncbi:MAG: lipoyl(octanoyl) transferase [Cryobacterium sp.]|nr:lipoyl(octanoyl) transferase [Oligoflexia bacterium]
MTTEFLSLRAEGSSIVPFARAWEFQKLCVEKRVRDEIPDTFLFVEHPPTITRGRGLQRSADRVERAMPLGSVPVGTEYFEIERGGDLTWHGPGQLVIYPIVKLDGSGFGPFHDVTRFLRKLESCIGRWLRAESGMKAFSKPGAAGIWISCADDRARAEDRASDLDAFRAEVHESELDGPRAEANARKIASIGIAVRKWVTYHGIGLNLANRLEPYHDISPCGFDPDVMTTLERESDSFRKQGWSDATRSQVEDSIARELAKASRSSDQLENFPPLRVDVREV